MSWPKSSFRFFPITAYGKTQGNFLANPMIQAKHLERCLRCDEHSGSINQFFFAVIIANVLSWVKWCRGTCLLTKERADRKNKLNEQFCQGWGNKNCSNYGNPHVSIASEELAETPSGPTATPGPLTQMLQLRAGLGTPAPAQRFLKVSRGVHMVAPVLYECSAPLKWRKVLRLANSKRIHLSRNSLFPGGSHIIDKCQDRLLCDFSFVEPSSKTSLVMLFFLF